MDNLFKYKETSAEGIVNIKDSNNDYGLKHNILNRTEQYQFIERRGDDFTCVGIKGGKYEGVIYKYGTVSIAEKENNKGEMPLSFQYDILDPNGLERKEFDDNFFNLIGDILVDIIDNSAGGLKRLEVKKNVRKDSTEMF